jgi:hypothetical protein
MLRNEAAWLDRHLAELPLPALDPLLSLGSGGAAMRDDKQPWIARGVYTPLEQRGVHIVHHEFARGPGVDIAGDLSDPAFLERLAGLGTRAVICCNVLEHLADREPLLKAFGNLVAPGASLVLTVPHAFPYHADPIDTMYRPSVTDLETVLPGFTLLSGQEVACGTLWRYLRDSPDARASMVAGLRTAAGQLRRRPSTDASAPPAKSGAGAGAIRYFLRPTSVTCAVFRREADH